MAGAYMLYYVRVSNDVSVLDGRSRDSTPYVMQV